MYFNIRRLPPGYAKTGFIILSENFGGGAGCPASELNYDTDMAFAPPATVFTMLE